MYIKSVTIDGFKTYGNPVEALNFDSQFTAITGPNGSGKSNFLDSICFVLGMHNSRSMRADSFQDLIFKQGQAGVTKAAVTINFDNSDHHKSPPLLRDCREFSISRQILSTGGTKCVYLVNGKPVPNRYVTDIFNSVHLNVNNPHFLVMQGRITSMLNNSADQNVKLIEEAVGTSFYRMKRDTHDKILNKKVPKMDETQKMLNEEIYPLIEKIRADRDQYNEFLKLKDELANAEKKHIAFSFLQMERQKLKWTEYLRNTVAKNDKLNEDIVNTETRISELDKLIAVKNQQFDAQSGSQLQKVRDELKKAEEEFFDSNRALERIQEKQSQEKVNLDGKIKYLETCETSYKEDKRSFKKVESKFKSLNAEKGTLARDLELAQEAYSMARSGQYVVAQAGADNKTLQEQLLENQTRLSEIDRKKMELEKQSTDLPKLLERKKQDLKMMESKLREDKKEFENISSNIQIIENEIKQLNYNPNELESLQQRKASLEDEYRNVDIRLRGNTYWRVNFMYTPPPVRDFKSEYIYGVVATLFQSKDSKFDLALDKAAGGKMYHVLVENEYTSRTLVTNKSFENRTTFLPLQQLNSRAMDERILDTAKRLVGNDNVHLALHLINFAEKYRPAFELIFGNVLICANIDIAMTLAYHPQIRKRCVTTDGDNVDPGGTQYGGSRQNHDTAYKIAQNFLGDKQKFNELQHSRENINYRIRELTEINKRYTDLTQKLDVQQYRRDQINIDSKMKACSDVKEEMQSITEDIKNIGDRIKEQEKMRNNKNKTIEEIRNKIASLSLNREEMIEEKLKQVNQLKQKLKKVDDELKSLDDCDFIRQRMNDLMNEIEETKGSIRDLQEVFEELQREANVLNQNRLQRKSIVERLKREEKDELKNIAKRNDEIREMSSQKETLISELGALRIKLEETVAERDTHQAKVETFTEKLSEYEQKYSWIANERPNFGAANGLYDFRGYTFENGERRLTDLKEKLDRIKANTNITLKNLHGNEDGEFSSYCSKKDEIEYDLQNLRGSADNLEEIRIESMDQAWEIINSDFNDIFSTVLPGANAKLEPLPGKRVIDGLEIKVCLGGMWKNDLSELSGGQRSLAGLSFILAMSRYNPAPIYILDEVDAALDLSHTENIGRMIQRYFKNTQFIVVSLKEGMFNNANRIFRTALRDGMSQITRAK